MDLILTASQRASVYSMKQNEAAALDSQGKLNSGLKIRKASDDATKYFMASGLRSTAKDFGALKDKLGISIKTADMATNGLNGIKKLLEQASGILDSARGTSDTTALLNYCKSYNTILAQINSLASDTTMNGKNLINGTGSTKDMVVSFNLDASSVLTLVATDNSATGLSLASYGSFASSGSDLLGSATALVAAALTTVKSNISALGVNMATLQTRDAWASELINLHDTAADGLTLVDQNEEGASLASLKLRLLMGNQNLQFSNEMNQSVLALIR